MPLLDHFRPPLSDTRHWESFHARWAGAIADELNETLLPAGYYAEEQVHVGRLEIDVATFEAEGIGGARTPIAGANGPEGAAIATLPVPSTWSPPAPDRLLPAVFPDSVEVLVFSGEAGPTLVAAVELVSPANKDREETRRAFVAKCAAYLQRGIGLIVVDTVTTRQANLCADLLRFLAPDEPPSPPGHLALFRGVPAGAAGAGTVDRMLEPSACSRRAAAHPAPGNRQGRGFAARPRTHLLRGPSSQADRVSPGTFFQNQHPESGNLQNSGDAFRSAPPTGSKCARERRMEAKQLINRRRLAVKGALRN